MGLQPTDWFRGPAAHGLVPWASNVHFSDRPGFAQPCHRLDDLGLDFVVVYPTAELRFPRIQDDAARRGVIRGNNIVSADYFKRLGDRLTPAAIIAMHTPDEEVLISKWWLLLHRIRPG